MASRHYTFPSARLRKLTDLRGRLFLFLGGPLGVTIIWYPITHDIPWGSGIMSSVVAIALLVVHLLVRKEETRLDKEQKRLDKEERQRLERIKEVDTLLLSAEAKQSPRYEALLTAGAIAPLPEHMDPFGVAIPLWEVISDEDWAVLKFYFRKTENVNALLGGKISESEKNEAIHFFAEEATATLQALGALRLQRAAKMDDAIWEARQMVNTDPL